MRYMTKPLKSVPNTKWICVNFSLIHQKAKTELLAALTFLFWAGASTMHMMNNFGKDNDKLFNWIMEILLATLFAIGFGWHLHNLVALHRMEKRGQSIYNKEL